jgi:HEAT repeat protein
LSDPLIIDGEAIRRYAEDARWQGQLAAEEGRRWAQEGVRIADEARHQAAVALADVKMLNFDNFKVDIPKLSGQAFMAGVPFEGQHMFSGRPEIAPPPVFQYQEPADSVYNVAREAFNRQDYSRAAARFAELIAKYPNSRHLSASAYYQAFSLYRVGTLESLRNSLKVLETHEQRFEYGDRQYRSDVPALQARVLRALADRKEPSAEAKLRDLYAKFPAVSCDREEMQIKSQVLNSLYQIDPDAAMPSVRQHLQTRDACNAELRRTAVFLLGNRPSAENTAAIVQLARQDTVRSVRMRAVEVLSRMPGEDAITALQSLMQDNDEQIQNAAVRSLMRSDNPKARSAMRSLIDRREASERQRIEAIQSFDRDNTSPEDATYLRSLFNRAGESERVKDAVVRALGNVPTEDNIKFLLDVAQNANESSSIRSSALRRVTSRQNLTTENIIKIYDATDSRSMRQSLVEALGQRPEQAAVNKLLDIVKLSTDPEVRSNAIQILLRKKDPAITQKVLDLIK